MGGSTPCRPMSWRRCSRAVVCGLAVLTACRSALGTEDPFSSIAAQLIRSGVDAVVAMGANLLVSGAARYAEGFYRALAAGTPVPAAQQRARQAMHDNPRRHLQRRHRDDPGSPVLVRDWWLPQLFQQRPFDLHPEAQARKGAKKPKRSPTLLRTDGVPCGPRHGFIGRALEIQRIEKYLTRGRLVVVRGPVGSGKTTLAREAADWLTRTGLYTGTCLVSFAHGGDASSLLRTIGGRLGLTASKFDPEDPAGAIEKLRKPAREKPLLVVADDLESLLPGGRAALDTTARAALWDVVLELPGLGCGALLIGGEGTLGDARLAPGKWVAHLAIEGLDPQDAVLLADQLLSELGIERARIPYRDLCGLLGQLDNLPLPIQLVLPSLRDVHRVKLQADLAAALERAAAGPGADLPRSLLAALDLWLGRLPDGTRSLLDRFSPFAVGADERRLLQVTQIPDAEWADLRATRAVRAADRRTSGRCRRPHFPTIPPDPGAIPCARPRGDDTGLVMRFVDHYIDLAASLQAITEGGTASSRAEEERELPNLKSALELALCAARLTGPARSSGGLPPSPRGWSHAGRQKRSGRGCPDETCHADMRRRFRPPKIRLYQK